MRRRRGRKRAIGARAPMTIPMRPNDRWSLDFVADQLTDGRRFRILAIVDDCTRECLALVADTSLSGIRVARELDRLIVERGKPGMIVSERSTRDGSWRCATPMAPRQLPSLDPPNTPIPTPRANSTLDKTWGQRH